MIIKYFKKKIGQLMNGGDVKALFPVNHSEKFLHLEDVKEFE
jgi:hypothetical protein